MEVYTLESLTETPRQICGYNDNPERTREEVEQEWVDWQRERLGEDVSARRFMIAISGDPLQGLIDLTARVTNNDVYANSRIWQLELWATGMGDRAALTNTYEGIFEQCAERFTAIRFSWWRHHYFTSTAEDRELAVNLLAGIAFKAALRRCDAMRVGLKSADDFSVVQMRSLMADVRAKCDIEGRYWDVARDFNEAIIGG